MKWLTDEIMNPPYQIKRDRIHYEPTKILSYANDKLWLHTICERDAGKSTSLWMWEVLPAWRKKNRPAIILRNRAADITEEYIASIGKTINSFEGNLVDIGYNKGGMKEGVVSVFIKDNVTQKQGLFCLIIAIGNPMQRNKSLVLHCPSGVYYDECIVKTSMGETYPTDTFFNIREIYNTYQRFCIDHIDENGKPVFYKLKFHAYGNPYSRFFPAVEALNVDPTALKPGAFVVGNNYVFECYKICDALKAEILKRNPEYKDTDSDYYKYAFMGESIDDAKIPLEKNQPAGFRLRYLFRLGTHVLGAFRDGGINPSDFYADVDPNRNWWVKIMEPNYMGSRQAYCVDFNSLVNNTRLVVKEDKVVFEQMKLAFARRLMTFQNTTCYYLMQSLYPQI